MWRWNSSPLACVCVCYSKCESKPDEALTREEQPHFSSHVLRDAIEHQVLGLLRAVHAHTLAIFCKVVLPCLLLQELLSLHQRGQRWKVETHNSRTCRTTAEFAEPIDRAQLWRANMKYWSVVCLEVYKESWLRLDRKHQIWDPSWANTSYKNVVLPVNLATSLTDISPCSIIKRNVLLGPLPHVSTTGPLAFMRLCLSQLELSVHTPSVLCSNNGGMPKGVCADKCLPSSVSSTLCFLLTRSYMCG